MANFGQLKMANNERTEKERSCKRHMLCSIFANLTIVLLLNYIMTSLHEKYIISKNGQIMQIMANYEVTEGKTNSILVSSPTNLADAVILTLTPTL